MSIHIHRSHPAHPKNRHAALAMAKRGPPKPNIWMKPRLSFDGLGKFDWAGAIGTAASAYTGQPNALNNPQAAIAAAANPAPIYVSQPTPAAFQPKKQWYQNPFVIGGATLAVGTLLYILIKPRLSRRR